MFKKISLLFFMIIQGLNTFGQAAISNPRIGHVAPSEHMASSWVTRGDLFYVSFGLYGGGYLYRFRETGKMVVVSDDIEKINLMLQNEMQDAYTTERFLKEFGTTMLLSFFSPGSSYIIDASYASNWDKYKTSERYGFKLNDLKASAAVLTKYISDPIVAFNNNKWSTGFYVALWDGSVEKWAAKGCVLPLSIKSLEKTKVEKEGVLVPMPEIGGNMRVCQEPQMPEMPEGADDQK